MVGRRIQAVHRTNSSKQTRMRTSSGESFASMGSEDSPKDAINVPSVQSYRKSPNIQSQFNGNSFSRASRRTGNKGAIQSYANMLALMVVAQGLFQFTVIPSFRRLFTKRNEYADAAAAIAHAAKFPHSPLINVPAADAYWEEVDRNSGDTGLKIIWLMSFPNSGTSFTVRLVRSLSMQFSASNYGEEYGENIPDSVPVIRNQTSGPFWMDEPSSLEVGFTYPTKFVITKTHCGVRCAACPPPMYADSTYSYRRRCTEGRRYHYEGDELIKTVEYYPTERVKKAVHLFRDPFDNVVSRYHHQWRWGPLVDQTTKHDGMPTREEFRDHCRRMNERREGPEKSSYLFTPEILELMKDVPCRGEFFRYVEWHNMAFITIRDLNMPSMILYYDWFTTKFEETAEKLMEFMETERRGEIHELLPGKFYRHYFTLEERMAVGELFAQLASRETWNHTKRFLFESHPKEAMEGL